ncbi:Glycosidase, partial [Sarracenia purpurea var. burkii]
PTALHTPLTPSAHSILIAMLISRPFPSLSSVLRFLLLCVAAVESASVIPTKIGKGYRLISIEESPNGGIVGHLQVKQQNSIYGPDIPLLQLYVK